jgi:hypothetical protein
MLTSLIVTPTHSPQIQMAVSIIGTNKGLPILTPGTIITSTKSIFVYKETATIPLNCTKRCLPFIGVQVSPQLMLTLVLPIHFLI